MVASSERYNNIAVLLHWLLAALILVQIYVGWTFGDMERSPAKSLWFEWHKTLGVLILLLSFVRLGWRLANPPPPFPADMKAWEKALANVTHVLFYVVMIGLPLTGWIAISSGRAALEGATTTDLVGDLIWPLIPGLPGAAHEPSEFAHNLLVKVTYAVFILHVAGALKHQFFERGKASGRMPPFKARA